MSNSSPNRLGELLVRKKLISLQQLKQKLSPLKKPIEKVAQATGELDKITAPEDSQTRTVVVKRTIIADTFLTQTPEFVASAVVMLILLYFLLVYDGVFLAKITKSIPRLADKKRAVSIGREIEMQISRYLLTITIINIALGTAVGVVVSLLGLANPVMWGALVAVLNFIPYLGATTGVICMTLGAILSFFRDAGTVTTRQNHNFHVELAGYHAARLRPHES